jgi:hypothetical protein
LIEHVDSRVLVIPIPDLNEVLLCDACGKALTRIIHNRVVRVSQYRS